METLKAARLHRDVVTVSGDDACAHLESQLTQDVASLAVGESVWSFLLDNKASIIALLRITRTADAIYLLDTDPGWGSAVRGAIDGFLFRMDVTFAEDTWDHLAVRGPGAEAAGIGAPIEAPVRWRGIDGLDILGPTVAMPDGVAEITTEVYDSLRVWAGWPVMGRDIVDKTTPAMTGLVDEAVSFTKGCYPGQEFVARVHYRDAAPPRRLVHVTFHPSAGVVEGAELTIDGDTVGVVTSVASCQPVALAFLKRSVEVPADLMCGGGPATASERASAMAVQVDTNPSPAS